MSDEPLIDQFLDEWEDQQESAVPITLDQFVKERMKGADGELIKSFREKAEQLASINRQLDQLAGPLTSVNHTLKGQSDDLRLSSLQPGLEPIPGYTLVSRLGNGGFGEVWKAESPGGFHVALKFVQIGGRVGEIEERSLNVIKDVRHPHLLSVFGTWRIGDFLIIATELADRTLLDRLDEARKEGHDGIPKEELFDYLAEAAKGIDFLNDPGKSGRMRIQHRDIKPQNLLLSGGSVKVGDFGLARSMKYDATGHTGSLTFAYAAPECFDGTTSNRSDQYSLAITYCQLRGGRLPFEGTQVEIMDGHRKKQPELSMIPANERPAIGKALAKRPKDRWNSCTEFVQALAGSASQPGISPDSSLVTTVQHRLAKLPKKWLFGSATIAFLLLFCLSLLFFSGDKPDENDQSQVGSNGASVAVLDDADTATKPITLAIMDFDNHSQDRNLDGFRLGFRDMLVTNLSHVSSIKVLERGRLKDLLDEHELAKSPFIDPKAAVRFGKGLSAKHVLTGSYVIAGNDIRIDVRLVSVETGEVMLADAVTGKKSNIFLLQQALSAKVLAGLDIHPSEAEQVALNDPQTNEFDAFRLYSEARLAQLKGQREEAKKRFKEALELDPDFSLAARELDRFESEALFRLSDSQQERAKAAGEIGQLLQEHWNKHQQIVERDRGDAEYFASMIVLAAHAGLFGDFNQERQLLVNFWKRFSESVPPSQALAMAQEIRDSIATESKFFQETVDSGDYGIMLSGIGGMTPTKKYLKTELQGHLHWPKWSVIWPFREDARTAFGQANIASIPLAKESWKSSFEADLPSDPHDYLEAVIDYGGVLEDQRKNPERFSENLRIYLSIAQYYGRLPDCPMPLAKELRDLQGRVLRLLDRVDVSQMEPAVIQNALPVLERIARIETDATKREQADKLLVRFVRQVRVNEGLPATSDDKPYNFYGQPLAGSPILVVWHVGELGGFDIARNRIEDHVRESLGDAVRALPGNTRFNFLWAGYVNEEAPQSLFEEPRAADTVAKQKGLGWLSQKAPSATKETRPLAKVIETIARDWDNHGLVVIVALNEDVSVPQGTVDFLLRSRAPSRFLVIATDKHKQLAQLAAASNGAAILLKAKGGFLDSDNVVAEPWDISNEKPKPSTSAVDLVQPTDITIGDFDLETRIKNQKIRQHLKEAVGRYLTSLDPQQVSNTRYFASLTMLAQIAGRIGHHPLEDALTRKWWAEIEPLADPAAALAYKRSQKQPRDRSGEVQPLLLDLKEIVRDESKELWFQPRIDGLFELPKPKLAPNSEPYIWASPIFWLRGMSEYREEMGHDVNVSILNYHLQAGTEFNAEFVSSASTSWMHDLIKYRGGVQSGRLGTAIEIAELVLRLCKSIPISDPNRQKWLIEGTEYIRKTRQEVLNKNNTPRDWVAASEYAPRRPWRGVERSTSTLPFFGRTLKANDGLIVICDLSVSDARDRSEAIRGLLLAVSEAGDGGQVRFILSGRQVKAWPEGEGMAMLDLDARTRLSSWIKDQDQSGPDRSSSTRGNLAKVIATASKSRDLTGKPPAAIAVVCQRADLEKFDPVELAGEIPIYTFAIPRLGSTGWSGQKTQIEKMRTLAKKSGGQFTVVSDDWIWLYLSSHP